MSNRNTGPSNAVNPNYQGLSFDPATGLPSPNSQAAISNHVQSPSGAAAVAAALGLTFDINGNIVANVNPRTGVLATLLGYAGGLGELASSTDIPAIVKYNNVIGGAVYMTPYGAYPTQAITTSGTITVQPWMRGITYLFDTTAGTINSTVNIANGFAIGQILTVAFSNPASAGTVNITSGTGFLATTQLLPNFKYVMRWQGTGWVVVDAGYIAVDIEATQYSGYGGQAGSLGVALGPGAYTFDVGQMSMSGVSPAKVYNQNEAGVGRGTKSALIGNDIKATTAVTTITELTTDGAAAVTANRFAAYPENSVLDVRVTVYGKIGSSSGNVWRNTYDLVVSVNSSGVLTLIGSVVAGTAISNGSLASTPPTAVAVAVASNHITVNVTPGVATSTNWVALFDVKKVLMT